MTHIAAHFCRNTTTTTHHLGDSTFWIPQVMAEVQLGEDVRSVRRKIGMEANDYLSLWRLLNGKAQEICQRTYGTVSLKEARTLSAIRELQNFYLNEESERDHDSRQKMVEALAVDGFAAWIIHSAIKRNNYKNRKAAQQAIQPSTNPSNPAEASASSKKTTSQEVAPGKVIFDPVRNV